MSGAEHPFPWSEDAVCRPSAENDAPTDDEVEAGAKALHPTGHHRTRGALGGRNGAGLAAVCPNDAYQRRAIPPALSASDVEAIVRSREKHRANGCKVHDEKFARCTCHIPPAETEAES